MMFKIFHDEIVDHVNENGRRDPEYALSYWKHMNENVGLVSPLSFNGIEKAALPASSAFAERVFGDLGRMEGIQRQSQLTSKLEMNEIIRRFVIRSVKHLVEVQKVLLHPVAVALKSCQWKSHRKSK